MQVLFFDKQARKDIILGHLEEYFQYQSNAEDYEQEELLLSQLRAETALEALCNCFADRQQFSSGLKARAFLANLHSSDAS